ncbi:MAG: DUF302 domain-containing protein [Vicinamibacterales bacterium]
MLNTDSLKARPKAASPVSYGFERRLEQGTVEEAVARVTTALRNEGFGVLTTIDIRDTLKKKLNAEFRPYIILGACNPTLAHKALTVDPQIGLLLPCNVVVQAAPEGGGVVVSIADPRAMFRIVDNPELTPVVDEADQRLRRVIASIG